MTGDVEGWMQHELRSFIVQTNVQSTASDSEGTQGEDQILIGRMQFPSSVAFACFAHGDRKIFRIWGDM